MKHIFIHLVTPQPLDNHYQSAPIHHPPVFCSLPINYLVPPPFSRRSAQVTPGEHKSPQETHCHSSLHTTASQYPLPISNHSSSTCLLLPTYELFGSAAVIVDAIRKNRKPPFDSTHPRHAFRTHVQNKHSSTPSLPTAFMPGCPASSSSNLPRICCQSAAANLPPTCRRPASLPKRTSQHLCSCPGPR